MWKYTHKPKDLFQGASDSRVACHMLTPPAFPDTTPVYKSRLSCILNISVITKVRLQVSAYFA